MPPDGGPGWQIGDDLYPTNPRHLIDDELRDVVRLWDLYRSGMGGAGHLPDTGGTAEQACWLLEAFAIMDGMAHELRQRSV